MKLCPYVSLKLLPRRITSMHTHHFNATQGDIIESLLGGWQVNNSRKTYYAINDSEDKY